MKIITWNVNGIRSAINKGLLNFIKKESPDIICLQETKSPKVPLDLTIDGYELIWNDARRPGYSGTAVFTKPKPKSVTFGIGKEDHDGEGRVITCEYPKFYLVNVYVPNSKRGLERLPYRHKDWDPDFLTYLKKLDKIKPLIACGDFNVAHKEIDLANPKSNKRTHGFTDEERSGIDKIFKSGFVDVFREFESGEGFYTWWSQMGNCRARNIGWRIDYFIVSEKMKKACASCTILHKVMGSDHCPVSLELKA